MISNRFFEERQKAYSWAPAGKNALIIFVFAFIVFFCFSSCSKSDHRKRPLAAQGLLDLRSWDFEKDGIVELNGDWQFYPNQLLRSADFRENQSFALIKVPGSWDNFELNGRKIGVTGYATYRLQIQLVDRLPYQLGLRLLLIDSAYELEINGKLIYKNGKVGRDAADSMLSKSHGKVLLPLNSNSYEIVLRVSDYHYHEDGGIVYPILIGSMESLDQEEINEAYIEWFLIGILSIMGIYHLGLYFIRRNDTSPLWFGIFSLIMALRAMLTGSGFLYSISPVDIQWLMHKIEYLTFYFSVSFFVMYGYRLFTEEFHQAAIRLGIIISILFSLVVVFTPVIVYSGSLFWFQIFTFIIGVYTIACVAFAVRRKREGSVLFLAAWILFFAAVLNDILNSQLIIDTGVYFHFGFIAFIFLQSYLLSRKFSNAFTTVEKQSLELSRLASVKDEFLANLSHELRTPLTAIYAYSEMFENNNNPADLKEYGREIYSNSEKLISYMDDLMLLTRMESDIDLSKSGTDIREIISENIYKLSKLAAEKNISIQFHAGVVNEIQANKKYMSKAIHAVIKNAVVYNKENGTVIVSAQNDISMLKITVSDTGIGMAARHLPLIFDRFYRVDSSDTYEVSGVGVGLFLAKKIIEMHGGSISVKSEMDRGSEFTVRLPVE